MLCSRILLSTFTSLANGLLNDAVRLVKPGRHVLVMVGEQSANIRGLVYVSFLKMACFNGVYLNLSIVKQIQPKFRYDRKAGVFFIGTKFRGDMMRSCSVVTKSKYASLQRTNKESANMFSPAWASATYEST